MKTFINIAQDRAIVVRSLKIALIVGTLLNLINQGSLILKFDFTHLSLSKLLLTYCVPYIVSTYSAVVTKTSISKSN